MFWHVFKTQLKVTLADRMNVFWAVMFPLILATLFNFAFSGLNSAYKFEAVPVAVVDNSAYQTDTTLKTSVGALSSGDDKILSVHTTSDLDKAKQLLGDQDVDGIIKSDGQNATVIVRGNSDFSETIIKTAVDQSLQTTHAVTDALKNDPSIMAKLGSVGSTNYINDTTNNSVDRAAIYFYALIGMACLYAGFFGVYAVNRNEANLSKLGARLAASPVKRSVGLLAGLVSGFVVAYGGNLILYLYLTQILNISFGSEAWTILLVMAVGSIAGIALGAFVSASSNLSESAKINILSLATMVGSLLAGMMGSTGLKHLIDQHAPLLAAINPVNAISDALYATYYFGVGQRYWQDLLYLSVFAGVAIFASWLVLRRKTYASL